MGLTVLGLLLMVAEVSAQSREPIHDFCRRFSHQTAVVDEKLYVDGGVIDWQSQTNPMTNFSNTFLGFHDLTSSPPGIGMPELYANLSKNSSIPSVSGGQLWPDDVNKKFYLYGGEYFNIPPNTPNLLAYDILNDNWDSVGMDKTIQSVSWGAGVGISPLGQAYVLGGYVNNATEPNWSGAPYATSSLVKYDMGLNAWTNSSGPDGPTGPGTAEGVMVYIPASTGGMLVHFGGVEVNTNGTSSRPMSKIDIYDITSNLWYKQTAYGAAIPGDRRRFCADVAWSADRSSYNIYLYGGLGFGANATGYDDLWILSLPSFTWIPYYQSTPSSARPKHSLSCNIVNSGQMLVIGGTYPLDNVNCDVPTQWGVHNSDISKVSGKVWNTYQTNITTYGVPPDVYNVIGGSLPSRLEHLLVQFLVQPARQRPLELPILPLLLSSQPARLQE
ncbi:hypothetical protein G7Y89_g1418 [Cudoniella acicularis]|uniref:Uncharacterized protein n=1 Tax=Cudoniella acicularis TaxID=354080 RepID=A0A8H4RVA1_9HELO|nr:hypothetical protein G7Y89_g1418 [Cudoniella acicularis]